MAGMLSCRLAAAELLMMVCWRSAMFHMCSLLLGIFLQKLHVSQYHLSSLAPLMRAVSCTNSNGRVHRRRRMTQDREMLSVGLI